MACVNTTAGILTLSVTDFVFPGFIPFSLDRSYRSTSDFSGTLGHGWGLNLGEEIRVKDDELVLLHAQGRTVTFERPAPGESVTNPVEGVELTVEKDDRSGRSVVLRKGKRRRRYASLSSSEFLPLVRIEDLHGNAVRFVYRNGSIVQVQDTVGRWFQLRYGSGSRLSDVAIVTEKGEVSLARYRYDGDGNLVQVEKRSGAVNRYEYADRLLVHHTDDHGVEHFYCYDDERRCVRSWRGEGFQARTYEYDHERFQTLVTNSEGAGTLYRYNEFNLVTETVNALGGTSRFQYDEGNNIVVAENQVGSTTLMAYDEVGRVVAKTRADGSEETFTYDEAGNLVTRTNPLGGTYEASYDARGKLVASETPSGVRTTFEYDDRGATSAIVFANGERLERQCTWNAIRFLHEGEPLYEEEFDLFGQLTARTYRGRHRIEYQYDDAGRRVVEVGVGGAVRRFSYDRNGRLASIVDENGAATAFQYDDVGIRTEHSKAGATTRFEHDSEGRVIAIHNALGQVHEVEYDLLGRMVLQRFFDGRVVRYEYDAAGAIKSVRDGGGRVTEYETDAVGRATRVLHQSGEVMEFEHSPTGRITRAVRGEVEVEFEYDEEDRVILQRQDDLVLNYAYGPHGKLRSVMDSEDRRLVWDWDRMLRPAGFTLQLASSDVGDGRFHASIEYDRRGAASSIQASGGRTLERENNGWRLPTWLRATSSGRTLLEERIEYTDGGRLKARSDRAGRSRRYEYDRLGRISKVLEGDRRVEEYSYDSLYNLTEKTVGEADGRRRTRFSYDQRGRLGGDGNRSFEYDACGRLVRVAGSDGEETRFSYTDDGLVERIELPDGSTTEFRYDALRRRVLKVTGPSRVRYFWDQQVLWLEKEVRGDPGAGEEPGLASETHYVFDLRSWAPFCLSRDGENHLSVNDHLGTPVALVGPDGGLSWKRKATVWGENFGDGTEETGIRCPVRFPGQYADREQPLVYNLNRYYDPSIGRYTSPDPIGVLGGMNLYAYTIDPVNYTDPLGLECQNFKQGEPKTLYRGDDRSPTEICANGFQPRDASKNISIADHVGGKTDAWVSTSYDRETATFFANPGDRVYVIDNPGCAENPGVEVDCDPEIQERQEMLMEKFGFTEGSEYEIAFKDVPPHKVLGYYEVGPNGALGALKGC